MVPPQGIVGWNYLLSFSKGWPSAPYMLKEIRKEALKHLSSAFSEFEQHLSWPTLRYFQVVSLSKKDYSLMHLFMYFSFTLYQLSVDFLFFPVVGKTTQEKRTLKNSRIKCKLITIKEYRQPEWINSLVSFKCKVLQFFIFTVVFQSSEQPVTDIH